MRAFIRRRWHGKAAVGRGSAKVEAGGAIRCAATLCDLNSRLPEGVYVLMRRFLLFGSLLVALALLDGCASDSDSPALYVGMSRERLRSRFGEPLRVERGRAGREDWYYSVTSSGDPDIQASVNNDGASSSTSISATITDQKKTQECPIHLSVDGYVIEPLPVGQVVRR